MSPVGPHVADTVGGAGSAGAPAAGSLVHGFVVLEPGLYSARIVLALTGAAEPQLANMRFRVGGVTKTVLPSTPGVSTIEIDRVLVNAIAFVDVIAIAAATVGSVYTATILLTRIG